MVESKKDTVPLHVRETEGRLLRAAIDQSGFNQSDFASRSGIGSKAYLTQLMSGVRPINLKAACQIAALLKIEIDYFSPRIAELIRSAIPLVKSANTHNPAQGMLGLPEQWPLGDVSPADFAQISEQGKREIIAFARGMARERMNLEQSLPHQRLA